MQQGIAVVLVFVGLKMLAEIVDIFLPVYVSLLVILVCITTAILYSIYSTKGKAAGQGTERGRVKDETEGTNTGNY